MISPRIVITHASFAPERLETLRRLLSQLEGDDLKPQITVIADETKQGSLWCWLRAMKAGLESDASHIVWLADDVTVVPGFWAALCAAIEARPNDVLDFYVNHNGVPADVDEAWFSTHDGYVGGAGVMPRVLLEEHLAWRDANLDADVANDLGVCMWCMAMGRLIYKSTRSLVDHDDSIPSLDGNGSHEHRRSMHVGIPERWDTEAVHLGRTYNGNHWELLFRSRPESWDLENVYLAQRNGVPVSEKPHVMICTPAYQPAEIGYLRSVADTLADLKAHDILVSHVITPGDSLVTRGRHVLAHEFLCSTATHFFQWDSDVECLDTTAVRHMLDSGRPIVGGAYPFRDGSRRVVANPTSGGFKEQRLYIDTDQTIEVAEVGTGFLMVRRDVLITMQKHFPERMYECDLSAYEGHPMWTLFQAELDVAQNVKRKRYASEDWKFCTLARECGFETRIYYPPKFRHWGKMGHEGHVTEAWNMTQPKLEAAE